MKPLTKLLSVSLTAAALTGTVYAQEADKAPQRGDRPAARQPERGPRPEGRPPAPRGRGVGQLSPEKARAAWELQAEGVANRLKLTPEQTSALVKAYTDTRTSMQQKQEELRRARQEGDGMDPAAANEQMRKAETEAKAKFSKALQDAKISDENAAKINASLGSIGLTGRGWDLMVDTLAGFNLEANKRQQALNAVEEFVVEMSKITESLRDGGGNIQEARGKMDETRNKLNGALKSVLTEEQMQEFESVVGRGPMRRGPEAERPRGRPDGDGPRRGPDGERPRGPREPGPR
jgi:chemotaxis protein histidine kinase CheA